MLQNFFLKIYLTVITIMCLNDYSNFVEKDEKFLSLLKNSIFTSAFVLYLFHLNHNVRLKHLKLFGTSAKLFSTFLIFSVSFHDKKKNARFLCCLMCTVFFILIILSDHSLLTELNSIGRFFFHVKMTKLTETATAHSFSFYMHTCIIIDYYWLQFLTCQLR